jgi:hypothetical protein
VAIISRISFNSLRKCNLFLIILNSSILIIEIFRFGRKRTLMGSLVLQISLAVVMAFSPWFTLYLVLRCFLGFISVSVVFSGFVLCK